MVSIKDIPAEVRWEIATKAANSQSVVYDMLVRQIIGDKIDEIMLQKSMTHWALSQP